MLVKNWMSTTLKVIDENDSMQNAVTIMKEHEIKMLPVLRKGELVGVISDNDLKRASASDATLLDVHELLYLIGRIKVRDIMTKEVITVPEDYTVEEAAQVMLEKRISRVPVVDKVGKPVGIITRDDIFRVFISLSGLARRGIQFAVLLDDRSGAIRPITDTIRTYKGKLASILTSYENVPEGKRIVYVRAYDLDRATLPKLKEKLLENGTLLHVIDLRDDKREIFEDIKA